MTSEINLADASDQVARAVDDLKNAHAAALGALNDDLDRLTAAQKKAYADAEARLSREAAIAQTRASNEVMAAHYKARDVALETVGATGEGALAVASALEIGLLTIDTSNTPVNSALELPFILPLIGRGNVVLAGNPADDLIRTIQAEALRHTTPGEVALLAYDPRLSNPLAPFTKLSDVDPALVHTAHSARDLDDLIETLTADIARVGALLQGQAGGLVEHRAQIGMPVERYALVSLHHYPEGVSEAQHQRLLTLAKVAPRHGIAFCFHTDPGISELPDWYDQHEVESIGETLQVNGTHVTWPRQPSLKVGIPLTTATEASTTTAEVVREADKLALPIVPFDQVQPTHDWGASSRDGITFAIGRAGPATVEITLGHEREQRHNALITGAVGQGKSNLLKVIIYSLCSRYSPDELSLLLLDFKEGVTLYPMAPTPGSPQFLPQAKILGIEADRDFGLSVLAWLEAEFVRRARLFKPFGDNIARYREANPDQVMPRIVLVIDEFHMLLADHDDKVGAKAAKLLEQVVRRGRSYGVHVILASQSISGIGTLVTSAQGVFSQFPIRLGLKNSPQEATATFGPNNDAASRLRYRGEAVLNLDYGSPEANQTLMVAAAEDTELASLRDRWQARAAGITPPTVFDGSGLAHLRDDVRVLKKLRDDAGAGLRPRALLGRPVTVSREPITFAFEPSPGRNLALIGAGAPSNDFDDAGDNMALGILHTAGLSLAAQHRPGAAEFVILDALTDRDRETSNQSAWITAIRNLGHEPLTVPRTEITDWIIDHLPGLADREPETPPVYVFGLSIDRIGALDIKQGMKPAPETGFQNFLERSAVAGVHTLFWWANPAMFFAHMGLTKAAPFDGTILLHGTEDTASRLHGPLTRWEPADNRGYYTETTASAARKIIPYSPLTPRDLDQLVEEVQA
jgi:hypothetical protein